MKFGTLSVVCGTSACNAGCPFCVSKMTTQAETVKRPNWRRCEVACELAKRSGVTTALITGKGEPTLVPKEISAYVRRLAVHFPLIELQTNGIMLAHEKDDRWINEWACSGMTLICVSVVHHEKLINSDMMGYKGKEFELSTLIERIHKAGMSVRINCTAMKGGVETSDHIHDMIDFCACFDVEQFTIREVTAPDADERVAHPGVAKWVHEHQLNQKDSDGAKIAGDLAIQRAVEELGGQKLLALPHGAMVYDVGGQNVCTNNCLTDTLNPEEIRQLIYFRDGHLRYDWKYPGAIII